MKTQTYENTNLQKHKHMKKHTYEKTNLQKNKPTKNKPTKNKPTKIRTYENTNLHVAFGFLTTYPTPELDLIVASP